MVSDLEMLIVIRAASHGCEPLQCEQESAQVEAFYSLLQVLLLLKQADE